MLGASGKNGSTNGAERSSERPPQARLQGPSIRFPVDPRDVPAEKIARRLGLLLHEFVAYLPGLRDRGFPPPDPTTGMYDMKAVEAWMDRRHPLTGGSLTEQCVPSDAAAVSAWRQKELLNG